MTESLPEKAPVVVIGGGICGVSTLYHLAKRNVPAVLLERKLLASGTTWHAAGIVGQLRDSAAQTELGKYTARLFRSLEEETGQATGYKQTGTINIALSDVRHEQLLRSHDRAARMGIESFILSAAELKEKWTWIRTHDVWSGFHVPSNGQVNPLDVCMALARGARQNGARIFEQTTVLGLVIKQGRVVAVETERGAIVTDKVLLAGGMWSHHFAKAHGIALPLHACEHSYIITEPMPDLPADQPILNISEERTYWKEDAGKLLIGAFEAQGKAWGENGISESFEFDEIPFDMEHAEPELERMFARMPGLANLGIQTFFNGPESFTPDGRPFLGPVPEVKGVFVAAGMNSNGILNSGGVGLTMAQWLTEGAPGSSMLPLLVVRCHPFQKNTAYNRERAAEAIGFHYGLHWPGHQVSSARGVRRVPLHEQLKARGAVFAERHTWEVPMYYDPASPTWPTRASLGWQDWSSRVEAEVAAVATGAGLLDQSMYAKILVKGPDAVTALNHVSGADIDVAVGTSIYTQFMNERGGIEADVTITRIEAESFLVITGHPSQVRDRHWIEINAHPDWHFEVVDMTSAFGLLSLHGPRAREIAASLSGDDFANSAFPFGAAMEIDLAHARVWALRRSFLGELGYEFLIPTEFCAHVFEQLMQAGEPLGLKPVGMFAMQSCRLEKAFRHFGHDIGEDDTPFETGLGFAVSLEKQTFLGREALRRQKDQGAATRYRTVTVCVPELDAKNGPYLIGNEPVWKDGKRCGFVTSGGWGFRLKRMIGLASLERDEGVSKAWIESGGFEVQIAGKKFPASVKLTPFYDPKGERMRA